ncbi:M48 family metalloprotease [uncultured Thiodictyon sp.]|uniref:M48 family metalloprotease n=1 Tax=uncultured Thiodictyon sp. TaxID=1846217 RepID=UPI0025DE293E|nr:M48 family metalloprotease [uncultured Thiodictyon sp.]
MKHSSKTIGRRRAALHLALALGLAGLPAAPGRAGQFNLPDMGNSSDTVMSSGAEIRLGKAFMRQVQATLPVMSDPLVTAYVESLGNELVAADKSAKGYSFDFFVIDQPVVNAFAGPGGHVGVYAGLILTAQGENELAAVMAHEIAHVTQRHLMRGYEDQSRLSIPTIALMVAAAILAAQAGSGQAGMAALTGIQAASVQRQINVIREDEKEADRIGIATLAAAGRDPYAMAGFFERLSKTSRLYENNAPEFLRTHPVDTNRIGDALGRAAEYHNRQRPDSMGFLLTRARLREASYNRPEKSLAAFKASLREGRYSNETAERYGYALALLRADQLAEAKSEATRLLAAQPSRAEFIVLDARIDLKQGHADAALDHLKQAIGLSPGNWAMRMAYAEALATAGQPRKAMEQLQAVERVRPGNPALYELLSQAAIRSGDKGASFRYHAQQLYAEGDLEPAIKQLDFALRQRDIDNYEAAQIQALRDSWKEEQRAQKKRGRDAFEFSAVSATPGGG